MASRASETRSCPQVAVGMSPQAQPAAARSVARRAVHGRRGSPERHAVVCHGLSLMVVPAEAAEELLERAPETARERLHRGAGQFPARPMPGGYGVRRCDRRPRS